MSNVLPSGMLPRLFSGVVVQGFGRGGRDLDCPTANLDPSALTFFEKNFREEGVFAGYARVDTGPLFPMIMSLGRNVTYNNEQRTCEVHILHNFSEDFYGSTITAVAIDYLRGMRHFNTVEELKAKIEQDKADAIFLLTDDEYSHWNAHPFFNGEAATAGQNQGNN